jgi:peptidoglycan/xylan/chitin deacetylase (PgdA/CDA1 family)
VLIAKRAIKRTAGLASVLLRSTMPAPTRSVGCVLVYHRVSESRVVEHRIDDWNVYPAALERHVASLVETADTVCVSDLLPALAVRPPSARPLACLTFDDGFQNFHDEVLPVLERYGARATVFVVTGYVGSDSPMPFDKWGVRHRRDAPARAWLPLSWPALERCVASGLVEVGGHSHRHVNAASLTDAAMHDEAGQCRALLLEHLGEDHARSFAYPYGSTRLGDVPPAYRAAVRGAGFSVAVTTDLGLAAPDSDPFTLPRIEVYRTDTAAVVQAKVGGSLAPFVATDRLRRARR